MPEFRRLAGESTKRHRVVLLPVPRPCCTVFAVSCFYRRRVLYSRATMRKPTRDTRRYCVIVTRKRTRRARRARRVRKPEVYTVFRSRTATLVAAPAVFAVQTESTRRSLTVFLQKLRKLARGKGTVRIDFSRTTNMTAAGTLLLAAELDRLNALLGVRRFCCSYPPNDVVAQVLQHVGIFEMLGQRRSCTITADNVKWWKVDSDSTVEGKRAHLAMAGYKHHFSGPEQKALYRGLTEAMTNCVHHAYDGERLDGFGNVTKWWMFSEERDGKIVVAFCDLGIGIPRSLPLNKAGLYGKVKAIMSALGLNHTDGNLIRAAMEVGKTRTLEKHRGKGLMDLRAVLDAMGGVLQIHSNGGFYEYRAENKSEQCKTFKQMSILGTLVLWSVPIPEEQKS